MGFKTEDKILFCQLLPSRSPERPFKLQIKIPDPTPSATSNVLYTSPRLCQEL
jgi:hypothetical protein